MMKKIGSICLVLCMLMSLTTVAFAADTDPQVTLVFYATSRTDNDVTTQYSSSELIGGDLGNVSVDTDFTYSTLEGLLSDLSDGNVSKTYQAVTGYDEATDTVTYTDVSVGYGLDTTHPCTLKLEPSVATRNDTINNKIVFSPQTAGTNTAAAANDTTVTVPMSDVTIVGAVYARNPENTPNWAITFAGGLEVQSGAALLLDNNGKDTAGSGTIAYTFSNPVTVAGTLEFSGNTLGLMTGGDSDGYRYVDGGASGPVTFSNEATLTVDNGGKVIIGNVELTDSTVSANAANAANSIDSVSSLITVKSGGELVVKSFNTGGYAEITTSGTAIKVENGGKLTVNAGEIKTTSTTESAIVVENGGTIAINTTTTDGYLNPPTTVTTSANNNQAIDLAAGAKVDVGGTVEKKSGKETTTEEAKVTVTVAASSDESAENYVDNNGNIILAAGATVSGDSDALNAAVILPDGTIIEGSETEAPKIETTTGDDGTTTTTVTVPAGGIVTKPGEPEQVLSAGGSVTSTETETTVTALVAKVGYTTYSSLSEAISAANGDTLTLLSDVTLDATQVISSDVTIDLDGHKITGNNVRAFLVKSGTLNLTGTGTVTTVAATEDAVDPDSSVIRVGADDGTAGTAAGLVVGEGVTIDAPATYGVSVFGNNTQETITVNGTVKAVPRAAISGNGRETSRTYDTSITIGENATITSTSDAAIYHPQKGTLTINGGAISGTTAIEMKSGTLTVSGTPAITATGAVAHNANSDGTSTAGYAVAIVENDAYAGSPTANLNGGTYTGLVNIVSDNGEDTTAANPGKIEISGGKYDDSTNVPQYLVLGKILNDDGTVVDESSGEEESSTHTVTLTASPVEGGTVTGEGSYTEGAEVTVTAEANEGYTFINWTDGNGDECSKEANYTFTMEADTTLTANFQKASEEEPSTHTVTLTFDFNGGVYGVTSGIWTATIASGDSYTFGTPILEGHTFTGWQGSNGNTYQAGASITPTTNMTFTAQWTEDNINTEEPISEFLLIENADMDVDSDLVASDELTNENIQEAIAVTKTITTGDLASYAEKQKDTILTGLQENLEEMFDGLKKIYYYIETYMSAKVTAYVPDESAASFTVALTPMARGIASVTDQRDCVVEKENAVYGEEKELTAVKNLEVTITLPSVFANQNVYVKCDGNYILDNKPVLADGNGKITFTAPHFSEYTFTLTAPATDSSSSGSGGGSGGGSSSSRIITVDDSSNGTVTVSKSSASTGNIITITVTPDDGYELDSLTVQTTAGTTVSLTKVNDTTYTFAMPSSAVTVSATFTQSNGSSESTSTEEEEETRTSTLAFTDVANSSYYYDAVLWAVANNITAGTTATTFSPDLGCTRAQVVAFLWRAAGSPKADDTTVNPFEDVAADAYCYDAVLWAVANGVTAGTSATTFSPDQVVSRAQVVTLLYRYAGSPISLSENPFEDVASDAYYYDAVLWAVENGVTAGTTDAAFSPDNDCTRAQIVTFMYRALAD